MIFFLLTLICLRIVDIHSQGYKRIILTGEHKINLGYNGTTDTIPAQKTVNLYKINPTPSTEQSTISFWFKPSVNQFNPLLRRRVLQTTQMNQYSGQIAKDGQTYNLIYLNYTAYDPFNLFNTYLTSYSSSFVFNILGTGTDNRLWNMIAASYQNTGSTYNFIFQTNTKSFNAPLSLYSFDPFNWVFVSVGVDYTVSNALMTYTFIQNDIVLQGYVNLDTPMKFFNVSMNFGALSKYPNAFQKNSACNCGVSSVICEGGDNIVSFSVDPPTNYFIDYYNDGSNTVPTFTLGTGVYGDSTFPTYKRMVMAIQFQQSNIANFYPGFNMATFNKVDFTLSFWVRIDYCDSAVRYLMSNALFDQFRFFLIFVQQANGQNMFYLTVFDEYKLLIPFQLGSWYLFLVSICNFLPSPKLFINALFLNNTSSSTYYSSFKAVYDATQFQYFISNINANSKSFQIGPYFTGIIKSFRYYRGAYFFPHASFKVDLPNCLVPISYPKTYFTMDGVTPGLNVPKECLLCKSGYYWDPNNKVCSSTLTCDPSTQHDFRDINTKCENCGTNCVFSVCGNGIIEGLEVCDDGQTGVASGCSADCKSVKSGWSCTTFISGNIPKSSCMSLCSVKNCMDCSIDATKCNLCYPGSFLDTVNKSVCYNPLPTGYYMTQDTNGYFFATPCSLNLTNCAICSSAFYCKNCTVPSVYALFTNGLQQTCVNACPSSYFMATDTSGTKFCKLCSVQNCSKCDTSPTDKCDQCYSGFLLDIVFFKCYLTIPYNYYYSNFTAGFIKPCASDINFCDTCQNNMMCTKCMAPYNLYSITSSTIPPPGTYTYCVQDCPSGTYLTTSNSLSMCLPCKVSNCNSCPSNPYKCAVCNTGKFLDLLNSICFDSQPTDYYIVNSTALTMMPCNNTLTQCIQCLNSNYCIQCSASYVLFTNNSQSTCSLSCPAGYYVQTQTNGTKKCQPCSKTNCDDCSVDPNQCVKCKSGKYLDLVNYNCLDSKTNNYYFVNQTLLTIKPCNSSATLSINCETCVNETFCTKCTNLSSWSLFSSPDSNTNVCLSQCPLTYYVSVLSGINVCVSCPDKNCSICSSINPPSCTKCISGNFMDVNTTKCYGTPPSNFYILDTIQMTIQNCGIPINNCLQCSNGSYCTLCSQSTFLFQKGLTQSCVSSCSSGYYNSGVYCLPCSVPNCSVCPADVCSQCIVNQYLDYSSLNTCFASVPNGYYIASLSPLSVMPCNYTLKQCIQCNSTYFCTECSSNVNYVLFINNSQSTCNTSCPAGYYVQTQANGVKQCQLCNKINCDDCSADPNQCIKCKYGKYLDLVNYNCLDNKNTNYYFVNQTLLTIKPCNSSLFLSINCETCSNETYCTQCTNVSTWPLFSYPNGTRVCLEQCPSHYYVSSLFGSRFCQGCPDANCSICSANNPTNCSKCIQGNYLDVNTTQCYGSIPSGFFLVNSSQMTIQNCSNAINSCLQCLNESYCTYCNQNSLNFLLFQNSNTQVCVARCSEGYYISGTTNKSCLPCAVSNCSVCPEGTCTQCIKNQSLDIINNSTCFSTLPNGYFYTDQNHSFIQACNTTLSSCNQCINSTECQSCTSGTLSTVNSSTICASNCQPGFYQGSVNGISKCLPCLVTNCSDCSISPSSCIKCFSDNYMDEDTAYCYNPIPNNYYLVSPLQMLIQKCNVSLNNCIQCANKTFCNKCLNNIPLLRNSTKRICVQTCPQEYFMTTDSNGNNVCEYCNVENCSDCVQDPNKCNKCISGKYLDISTNDTCYDTKPDGYYYFNLNLGEIEPCGIPLDHCELCQNSNFCTQCIPTDNWALYLNKTSLLQICLSVCPETYFKNQSTSPLVCSSCPGINCSDCSGADPNYCKACLPGKFRDELTTICYDYKPDTHYISDPTKNFILPCNFSLKNCQQCVNSSYCSLCQSSFALFLNNSITRSCVSVCPNGFYRNQTINSNQSCQNCLVSNCSDCSLIFNKCNACTNPNFLDISTNQTCYSTIPKTHYIYDWKNYLISSCQSAINNCQECLNSTSCTLCYPSKYLDISTNQACYDSIPKTHFLYDSVTNQVKFCNSSLINCQECLNSTYCNICQSPFGLFFENQTRICVSSCPNGYFMNSSDNLNQICQLCSVANCSDCSLNSNKCNNCFSPNYLDISTNQTCYSTIPNSYFLVENSANKIAPCNSTIKNCSQCANSSICTFCSLPYTLNSKGACVSMCSASYYLNDQGSFRSCQKCPVTNCSDCYSDPQKCFLCLDNKYLDIDTPLCFDSVPKTYFLVQNSTQNLVKLCNSTLNSCLECQNDSVCTKCSENLFLHPSNLTNPCTNECPTGYYQTSNNSCLKCLVENCSNCTSDPSKCSSCILNKYLDPIKSICYNNVPKDHFLVNNNSKYSNQTNQTENVILPCSSSIPNCAECANDTFCETCSSQNYFLNASCQTCSNLSGFYSNCSEICGDGYLFNSSKSGHQCDDGNNIDGDGCSSNCQIEKNWKCVRESQYTPDHCFDSREINIELSTRSDNPEKVIVHPSRPLKFQNESKILNFFNISLLGIDKTNYSLDARLSQTKRDIEIIIDYKVTVKNMMISFNLVHPSRTLQVSNQTSNNSELCDENNISISEKYYTEPIIMKVYDHENYNQEQTAKVDQLHTYTSTVTAGLAISTSSLSIFQTLNIFWLMVDAMQIANFFLYMNIFYPSNLQTYFKILSSANLNFIPNPFNAGSNNNDPDEKFKIFDQKIVDQRAPLRFESLGKTSLFLKNAGLQLIILLSVWVLYYTIIGIDYFLKRKNTVSKMSMHIVKLREKLEFGWMIQAHLMILLEFSLGCLLQVRNLSYESIVNGWSSTIGILGFIYILLFFLQIGRVVNMKNIENEEFKKKYDILFEEYQKEKFIQRNYPALVLVKKYLMVLVFVMLHDFPSAELALLMSIFLAHLGILIIGRPFKRRLTNAVMILSESIFIVVICLILKIFLIDYQNEDLRIIPEESVKLKITYGWVIIALISFILFSYLVVFFRQQVLMLMEFFRYLQNSKLEYRKFLHDVFRKKNINNKPVLKSLVSGGSLGCEMVEDPYKQISEDQIDEKFLHVETLPETSFSKFVNNFKTKNTINTTQDNKESKKGSQEITDDEPHEKNM